MPKDGVLTMWELMDRTDKSSYVMSFGDYSIMPYALWRNESQPGNALDERDEICTAQSRQADNQSS